MAETKFKPTSDEISTEGSEKTPVPGGLLLDLLERARSAKEYVPEAGGTPDGLPFRLQRSGVAWTMGTTESNPTSLLTLAEIQGYDFGGFPDTSTQGLQIASTFEQSQIIVVPYTFSACGGDVLVDVSCLAPVAGTTCLLSVGYALADGQVQLPRQLQEYYGVAGDGSIDPTVFVNVPSDVFTLTGATTTTRLARLTLRRGLRGGETRGWILIAVQSSTAPEAFDILANTVAVPVFQSGSSANRPDPNHMVFLGESGYGYGTFFGTTSGVTGAKYPLALRIRALADGGETGQSTWHAVQHIRPQAAPFTDPSASVATLMFYPHFPEWFMGAFDISTSAFEYSVDLFDMGYVTILGVSCTEAPDLPATVTVTLQPGEPATAGSAALLIDPDFGYTDGPFPVAALGYRVKGKYTGGNWCGFNVLEKNEAIPWILYADTSTFIPPSTFYAAEGWSSVNYAYTAFSSTPGRGYWLTVEGADESTIPVSFTVGGIETAETDLRFPGVYRPRPFSPVLDPTFQMLPPDPLEMADSNLGECYAMSFTPAGLADRFTTSTLPRQNFPNGLLYPIFDTDHAGSVSNYMVAGSLPFESLTTIFDSSNMTYVTLTEDFFSDRVYQRTAEVTFTTPPPDDTVVVWSMFTAASLIVPGNP